MMGRFLAILILACLAAAGARAQSILPLQAGQMLLVGFQGDSVSDPGVQAVIEDIRAGRIGGVMYLRHNVSSLDEVRRMNAAFQAASPPGHPVLIALDQEGGSIERLTEAVGFEEIPSAAVLGEHYPLENARDIYADLAARLKEMGFNLNLGPVVDVNVNPNNPIVARYGRSYGRDPGVVTEYARAFIEAHHEAGLLTVLKHFPGHGSSTEDSHEGFVDISDSWIRDDELQPYRELIREGIVDMIMPGHLYLEQESGPEEGQPPASLSARVIDGMLREQLFFQGVVITDDMEMSAVLDLFGLEERVNRAVRAGDDILLFSNTANYRTGIGAQIQGFLVEDAQADSAFAARIAQSYARIMELKEWLLSRD